MTTRQILVYWLWMVGIAATLIGLVAPSPVADTKAMAEAADEPWQIPKLAARGAGATDAAELARANLWGSQFAVETATDDRGSRWRLAGVVGEARQRQVLLKFGDDRLQTLKAGDRLPDGTMIGEVKENGICIVIEGKRRFLPLPGQTIPVVW
jgi:hypothetical protein